jgi:hypothetical protein
MVSVLVETNDAKKFICFICNFADNAAIDRFESAEIK